MKNKIFETANIETQSPTNTWVNQSNKSRISAVESIINDDLAIKDILEVITTKSDGQVLVKFLITQTAEKRGTLLLDLEQRLKNSIDIGITVWLEPLGDKNSLRNLRGIKVKTL